MLTERQIFRLTPLLSHLKFGKILLDAIESWKQEDIFPGTKSCGIDWNSDSKTYKAYKRYKFKKEETQTKEVQKTQTISVPETIAYCCIIGAASIGKENKDVLKKQFLIYFGISTVEYFSIQKGFDLVPFETNNSQYDFEAYKFGSDVHKALWC